MNKSFLTNLVALLVTIYGVWWDNAIVYSMGIFALSGAVTNWIAIYMLFEKIPGIYGSGIIPSRFEEFKMGIKHLIMSQFFTRENIDRFLQSDEAYQGIELEPIVANVDFEPTFDGLVEVIEQSSFGHMLAMVGGATALEPMRQPFVDKIKSSIISLTQTEHFKQLLKSELDPSSNVPQMMEKVEVIVEQRLSELTPTLVKNIIQQMIRKHLGWLVVWGGVFGGIIGCIAALVGSN